MKWGIWCTRSNLSVFGHAESWSRSGGEPVLFDTKEDAEAYLLKYPNNSPVVTRRVVEYDGRV